MKWLPFHLLITLTLPALSSTELWIDFQAKVQNLHHELQLATENGKTSPDPSKYEKPLKQIDASLDALVKAGELQSFSFQIKIPDKDKITSHLEKKITPLFEFTKEIGETYGIYAAQEMCDLGARLSFMIVKPVSTVKMHIRLPEKEMKTFLKELKKLDLIEKIPEIAKAPTPAPTKPIDYKNAPHWFIFPSYATRALLIIHALDTADKYSHLPYKFGSADPENGGFDCSGATSYVMKKAGLKPPRTSAQQFIWLRDKERIHLIGKKIESIKDPAFSDILPGDLAFWSGTYSPTDGRTVNISHVGIYLGTEKDGRHIMACATNGRSYRGKKGNGYGIYDFKLPSKSSKATFVGYGSPL